MYPWARRCYRRRWSNRWWWWCRWYFEGWHMYVANQRVPNTGTVAHYHWGISRGTGYWVKNVFSGTTMFWRPRWQFGARKCAYLNVDIMRHEATLYDQATYSLFHGGAHMPHPRGMCTDWDNPQQNMVPCWQSLFPSSIMRGMGCCQDGR